MGYNKAIITGNLIEIFEYEKNLPDPTGTSLKRRQNALRKQNIFIGGEDSLRGDIVARRPDHARRASMGFRRLVSSNLGRGERPVLLTLTYAENITDIRRAYADFTDFIKVLRYRFGKGFSYVCVPEFQKRGAIHFHSLCWGLPSQLWLQERKSRTVAGLWQKGFIYFKETDGDQKISSYLAKYMAKAFLDPKLKNQKAYVSSRNLIRPKILSGISPLWPILEDNGVVEKSLLQEKSYMTQWLGKGRYRQFNIKNEYAKI